MTTIADRVRTIEDNYFEEAWYRSGAAWMLTLLCILAHVRVVHAFLVVRNSLPPVEQFVAVVIALSLHIPWASTLIYRRRTRERLLAEATAELRREIARIQLFAVGFLYFLVYFAVDVLMAAVA